MELQVYNSLTGTKEKFEPIHEGRVGMYVCGPTVYNDVHLGNCRTFASFDVIFRYLKYLGYKVRYVRNITDVGHLVGDVDTGEEGKIEKQARLEQLEPMEVVQKYTNGFHQMMATFNILPPSIEPRATGHIIEQIEMVQAILKNGYGYEKNGSVYFNTLKFVQDGKPYGKLSGRKVEDLLAMTRDDLKNQDEKNHPSDFAIWIKADEKHLMRWNSPWGVGFPGWHLECSAMSTKYLGERFDIHGGGGDLKFPHHENEIAQNIGACDCSPARYWLHGNMLEMNNRKMSKSDGNTITPQQLFSGDSPHITKAYSPMAIRFFMLQAHYRSTLNITDDALKAAEKGYRKLMETNAVLQGLSHPGGGSSSGLDKQLNKMMELALGDMNDDFNTPKALSKLFAMVPKINSLKSGRLSFSDITEETLDLLKKTFHDFIYHIFGLLDEKEIQQGATTSNGAGNNIVDGLMGLIMDLRQTARSNKDYATADQIRNTLQELKIQLKDGKEGTSWTFSNN